MSLKMEATTLKSHKSAAFRGSDANVSSHESTRNITVIKDRRVKNNQQLTEDDVPPVPDVNLEIHFRTGRKRLSL